jgi:hypothetical protein
MATHESGLMVAAGRLFKKDADGDTRHVSDYRARDGKFTVRRQDVSKTNPGSRGYIYYVHCWQDGKSEVVWGSNIKRKALKQATFLRRQFEELDKA